MKTGTFIDWVRVKKKRVQFIVGMEVEDFYPCPYCKLAVIWSLPTALNGASLILAFYSPSDVIVRFRCGQ